MVNVYIINGSKIKISLVDFKVPDITKSFCFFFASMKYKNKLPA